MAFTIESNGVYRSGDLVMIPVAVERILAHLYYAMESQGLLEIVFPEGIKPTLLWFLGQYLEPEKSTLLCYRETPSGEYDGLTPIGFGWINKSWKVGEVFSRAETGMAFLKGVPSCDTVELAKMMIEWAFRNLKIDSLIGVTPYPNRPARLFGQHVGFQQTTPLEGYSCWRGKMCSVVIQSMTRQRWNRIQSGELQSDAA